MKQETSTHVTLNGIKVDLLDIQSCHFDKGVYTVHLENGMKMKVGATEGEALMLVFKNPRGLRDDKPFQSAYRSFKERAIEVEHDS